MASGSPCLGTAFSAGERTRSREASDTQTPAASQFKVCILLRVHSECSYVITFREVSVQKAMDIPNEHNFWPILKCAS